MSLGAGGPPSSDDQSASLEDKDCPSPGLDTLKESTSGGVSASASSSSAESSSDSEAESDDEEPKAEGPTEDPGQPSTEQVPAQESQRIQPACEHCTADTKLSEQVTPRLLSKGQFLLKVDGEGTYQCTETGLIFEVTRKVDIKYCVLSWSKFAELVEKPWVVGGPLFDVKCEPGGLSSIQFPHSLCLGHHDTDMTFRVFHVKSSGASLEHAVDHSGTHVTWRVSSLSPVGPVIQSEDAVSHHGAVILYKAVDQNPSLSFRVYIATNNESFIKDISKAVKHSSSEVREDRQAPGVPEEAAGRARSTGSSVSPRRRSPPRRLSLWTARF
ncbi:NACHT, LRR and PYD domains-containing protein 1a allele 5-like [Sorex araneus]|uniref:NACHT, LRR and PYD domains-containing protein 1a allele 5-like n=1 Tax=Sorex araneus TaxID=42254 RepID=UPI002433B7DB|nr:NACHT, LRR and PYD domains-containing protein 1a allele 5-like [Sorex araneus]